MVGPLGISLILHQVLVYDYLFTETGSKWGGVRGLHFPTVPLPTSVLQSSSTLPVLHILGVLN